MRFTWDPDKDLLNIKKHKLGFQTAQLIFRDPFVRSVQDRVENGEERWQSIGCLRNALIVIVAHTVQEIDGEEIIRIISARKATAAERRFYEEFQG